jgi:hypothetical protein
MKYRILISKNQRPVMSVSPLPDNDDVDASTTLNELARVFPPSQGYLHELIQEEGRVVNQIIKDIIETIPLVKRYIVVTSYGEPADTEIKVEGPFTSDEAVKHARKKWKEHVINPDTLDFNQHEERIFTVYLEEEYIKIQIFPIPT